MSETTLCEDFVRVAGPGSPAVKMCKSLVDEDGYCTNQTDEHISTTTKNSDVHE